MLYTDDPARIISPGTFNFAPSVGAVYTVGRDHVQPAMAGTFRRTRALSCDIETFGLGLNSRRLKSVAFGDDQASVVFDPRDPFQAHLIRKAFEHAEELIFFNSTFDVPSLYLNGLIRLTDVAKVTDPLIYARLATPGVTVPKTLEALGDRYLNTGAGGELMRAFKALGLTKKDGFFRFDLDRPIYLQGAASDPLITHRVWPLVVEHAFRTITQGHPFTTHGLSGDEAWTLVHREQRINRVFLARSCRGFKVDFEYLDRYREENALELAEAEEALAAAGVRPGNGQDLAKVLEARGELPPDHPRTAKTGAYQMTKADVKQISSPLAGMFIRQKEIKHVAEDYIQKTVDLSLNGRVHPVVNILAAVTGRASYGSPPTHQFSGPARGIILPDDGDRFTSLDLVSGEPFTIMNLARDLDTIESYDAGVSPYVQLGVKSGMLPTGTTKDMCEREPKLNKIYKVLKIVVLADLYGEGLAKLSADLGLDPGPYTPANDWEAMSRKVKIGTPIPRFEAARKIRATVRSGWPKTAAFVDTLKNIAKQHRKVITVSGRVIPIGMGKYGVEAHKGVNYPCQGGQYDLVADILIRCIDAGLDEAIYLTQHDELLVSTDAAHDIRVEMERPNERLTFWAGGRPAKPRTDREDQGERWGGKAA